MALVSLVAASGWARADDAGWHAIRNSAKGPPRAIGAYGAGCLQGAAKLALRGRGYRVIHPDRRRYFGHPELVDFVRALGATAKKAKLPTVGVGDLGQARGGPTPTGHKSHQNGLDADLWYMPPRKGRPGRSMVHLKKNRATRHLGPRVRRLLRLAATDDRVARIFVHPVVKRELCRRTPKKRRGWLRKIRPWWGHYLHFHVRLACPEDSPTCVPQEPPEEGDGCDDLDWWFSEREQADRDESQASYQARVDAEPELPPACRSLLEK